MPALLKPAQTFCNLPFGDDLATIDCDVAIVGAPHGTPYMPGTPSHAANATGAVRRALGWFSAAPTQIDFDTGEPVFGGATVVDCGDVPGDLMDGAVNRKRIEEATHAVLQRNAVPILLGGDDSTPIPFIQAYEKHGPLTIVQVDAHIDWRHEREGVTHGYSSTMRRASEMGWVKHMIQIGARGPGSARAQELADAKAFGSKFFTARDVHANGLAAAIAAVPKDANVILAIDVDGIDPSVVPGVILPAFGGLSYQQMLDVIHGTAARARIVGANFVEYVPERDPQGSGAQAIARLVSNTITAIARQRR
ncbi:MAG: arginase family protein [Alphaproteobacteria bacterium]|nr:arginase family protein [Alphaproteobacteria bacterium]